MHTHSFTARSNFTVNALLCVIMYAATSVNNKLLELKQRLNNRLGWFED